MYPIQLTLQKVVDICAILTENLRMSRLQAFSEERRHFMKDSVAVEKGAGKAKKSHHLHRSYHKKVFKKVKTPQGGSKIKQIMIIKITKPCGQSCAKKPSVVFANAPREMPSLLKGNWKRVITQKNDLIKSWILSRQRIAQCTQLIAKDRRPQFVNNYICQSWTHTFANLGQIHLSILNKYICKSWTNTMWCEQSREGEAD